ncbi:MAG: YitT family protein [Clostridia bacterium]|nr:YitT family protein [Clostridia bacterium]
MKQHRIRDYLMMTAGTILLTVGVYFFKIPNGFSTGGVSGIGTLLGKITPVSPATWISILNVVLLLIGFAVLGKETGLRTVYCSLLFSGLTQALELLLPLDSPLTDQPFL